MGEVSRGLAAAGPRVGASRGQSRWDSAMGAATGPVAPWVISVGPRLGSAQPRAGTPLGAARPPAPTSAEGQRATRGQAQGSSLILEKQNSRCVKNDLMVNGEVGAPQMDC